MDTNSDPQPPDMTPWRTKPWHGILVAAALPLRDDLSVD